ncbi:MAG: hypothetical protein U0Q11_00720 [Vicinamibacterales bacterium]
MTLREAVTAISGLVTMGVAASAAFMAWAVIVAPTSVVSGLLRASDLRPVEVVVQALYGTLMHVVQYF